LYNALQKEARPIFTGLRVVPVAAVSRALAETSVTLRWKSSREPLRQGAREILHELASWQHGIAAGSACRTQRLGIHVRPVSHYTRQWIARLPKALNQVLYDKLRKAQVNQNTGRCIVSDAFKELFLGTNDVYRESLSAGLAGDAAGEEQVIAQ
jgi:hypothetical protein